MNFTENHLVGIFMVSFETHFVGMTGFEPATTRTPCVYATRLRHIPDRVIAKGLVDLWQRGASWCAGISTQFFKFQYFKTQLSNPPPAKQPGHRTEFMPIAAEGLHSENGMQK